MNANDIKTALPGDVLLDSQIKGLQVRVTKTGAAFYLRYRNRERKERRPKIGSFPQMGIPKAREIAKGWLADVRAGDDPMDRFEASRQAPTVSDVCDLWLKAAEKRGKKALKEDRRLIDTYIRPRLGKTKIEDVNVVKLEELRDRLEKTPHQANQVLSRMSSVLKEAERLGYRPTGSNPAALVRKFKVRARVRYATPDELKIVWAELEAYEKARPQAVGFIRLLMFTGARPSEIASARWDQIAGSKLVLAEHKTDNKGRDRVIHLNEPALDVIRHLPRLGPKIVGIRSPKSLWEKIREKLGDGNDLRIYDLRHTFASMSLATGRDFAEIGELLGHTSAASTKRYAHLVDERGQKSAAAAGDAILEVLKR